MAKVSDLIFCLKATNADGVGVTANNILTAVTPEYIPGLFSFSVVITLVDIDCTIKHNCRILFEDGAQNELVNIECPTPVLIDDIGNLPSEYRGLNLAMDWNNVNFKKSGEHTIKVFLDDKEIAMKHIYVKGKNE